MDLQKIFSNDKGPVVAFAESRIGGRSENQDSYGWKETAFGYLVVVCDGMGGGPGGKTASSMAVNEILLGISEAESDEDAANVVIKAIRRANMAIIEAANENPKLHGMGTTAVVLLVSENKALAAHVGDSRIYQIRDGKKIFRTFDHSYVFEMVSQGVITEEQARLSEQSNIITRALGVKPDVEVDLQELTYDAGDRFLLCSDGIHGMLPEEELIKLLKKRDVKLGVLVDNIATQVDETGRTTGGYHDNLTLAVVQTKTNSKIRNKMTKQTKQLFIGLITLFIMSFGLNIFQCSSVASSKGENVKQDTVYVTKLDNEKFILTGQKIKEVLGEVLGGDKNKIDSISEKIDSICKKVMESESKERK